VIVFSVSKCVNVNMRKSMFVLSRDMNWNIEAGVLFSGCFRFRQISPRR